MQYCICPECGANLDHGEKCNCQKEKEAAPLTRMRPPRNDTTNSLSGPAPVVKPDRGLAIVNELRQIRIDNHLPAKEMVEVVKQLFPKYDKTLQSKCERGDEYGILIQPAALDALRKAYSTTQNQVQSQAVDEVALKAAMPKKASGHRFTCRISARLPDATWERLQHYAAADGYGTMQDWILAQVTAYIMQKQREDAAHNATA